jgi:hypothetical protein
MLILLRDHSNPPHLRPAVGRALSSIRTRSASLLNRKRRAVQIVARWTLRLAGWLKG